ncbi:hypothetical protein ABN584_23575 [Gloeocapsa sp. BRSZ]
MCQPSTILYAIGNAISPSAICNAPHRQRSGMQSHRQRSVTHPTVSDR